MEDKRVSLKRLEEIRAIICARDNAILSSLGEYKYMTTHQIRRLYFYMGTEHAVIRATNRALARLREQGVVYSLNRRIGGVRAGSGAYCWTLTAAGHRLLALIGRGEDTGITYKRAHEPSTAFLAHTLAVVETAVKLRELERTGKTCISTLIVEPGNWRQYTALGGMKYLKPDMFAVLESGEYEDHFFIEIDLSTESPCVVIRKCQQYLAYRNSGNEQRDYGVFPFVVWIVPDSKRKDSIKRHIHNELKDDALMFTVITMDELEPMITSGVEAFSQERMSI